MTSTNNITEYINRTDYSLPNAMMQLYDIRGVKVLEQPVFGNKPVDISTLPSGLYFCKLIDKENQVFFETKKVSVLR